MPLFYSYEKLAQISFVTVLVKWGPELYIEIFYQGTVLMITHNICCVKELTDLEYH